MRAIGFGLEPGFKQSRGAQIEHGVAETCGEVKSGRNWLDFRCRAGYVCVTLSESRLLRRDHYCGVSKGGDGIPFGEARG